MCRRDDIWKVAVHKLNNFSAIHEFNAIEHALFIAADKEACLYCKIPKVETRSPACATAPSIAVAVSLARMSIEELLVRLKGALTGGHGVPHRQFRRTRVVRGRRQRPGPGHRDLDDGMNARRIGTLQPA